MISLKIFLVAALIGRPVPLLFHALFQSDNHVVFEHCMFWHLANLKIQTRNSYA